MYMLMHVYIYIYMYMYMLGLVYIHVHNNAWLYLTEVKVAGLETLKRATRCQILALDGQLDG